MLSIWIMALIFMLRKRRGNITTFENIEVSGEKIFNDIAGDCYEMEVWMDMKEAVSAGIN